ncbi:MAG: EamA family transporter [Planctomycetota bacterium]
MWIIYALFSAFAAAGSRAFIKSAGKNATNMSIVFCRSAIGALLAWILIAFTGLPLVKSGFYLAVIAGCAFDVTAILCMSRALQSGSMAKSVPLLSFTPAFLLITGELILGETATMQGIIGVLVIVVGSYFLHVQPDTKSILQPIKLLFSRSSARLMLLCSLFFGFTGPFFKRAIQLSDPFFAMAASLTISTLLMALLQLARRNSVVDLLPTHSNWRALIGVGIAVFFVALSVNLALDTGLVSYVISLKRLGILVNIAIGAVFFGEKDLLHNLLAGGTMVAGAALITLS